MIKIEFDYNQRITIIQANLEDTFKNVISKYIQKTSLDPNRIIFLSNGTLIKPEETVSNQANQIEKEDKIMKLIVLLVERTNIEDSVVQSKDIICPECHLPCRIKIDNFKIHLFGCQNNHSEEIEMKGFFKSQKINISDIKCGNCKIKNKGNSVNHEFYRCLTCKKNLCLLCKSSHQSEHSIINFDLRYYICLKHNERFIKYCKDCNKNICYLCEDEHGIHAKIELNEIKLNKDEINNNLSEMKEKIEIFNANIQDIINKLIELVDIMNNFYDINSNILNNYEKQNRNYQTLENINQLVNNNNEILKIISNINNMSNIKEQLYNTINLYNNLNNISSTNLLNKMTIIYDVDNNKDEIKIFGKNFVENNKNNCYLLINNKKHELCESVKLNKNHINEKTLEISLEETEKITNMSYMFSDCCSLKSIPDISDWDSINVNNMNSMFYNCNTLKSLPDISDWVITNVTDMNSMFSKCSSLLMLPDISKWNPSNLENMSFMFHECKSLISLPNISKWNTINVTDMSYLFYNCNSLKTLPDISKWNTENVTNMYSLFYYCNALKSLPDISKWNTSKVTKMGYMFSNCISLKTLPDISKWNTNNVTDMSYMFDNCNSLKSLPDISKWNTLNVTNMSHMFNSCSSLIASPDISKWNKKKVTDMSFMFNDCGKLKKLTNSGNWRLNKSIKRNSMFDGCDKNIIPKNLK